MIVIDARSDKPIYEQIIDQMKFSVLKGYLQPGDPIMSVRKLAIELSVTPGTVAKAYQELEREKVIETIRGRGTYISAGGSFKIDNEKIDRIKDNLRDCCVGLAYLNYSRDDVKDVVDDIFDSNGLDCE